jgi:hypothetical protein
MDAVAEDLGLVGEGGEDGADGVVRGNLLQAELHLEALLGVDFGAVALGGDVGFGLCELFEEGGSRPEAASRKSSWASWMTRAA